MKKLLLILMFVLPLFTTAQQLPIIYTYLSEGAKYIDREVWLKGEINDYTNFLQEDEKTEIQTLHFSLERLPCRLHPYRSNHDHLKKSYLLLLNPGQPSDQVKLIYQRPKRQLWLPILL